jgi:hypothetical protein
MKTREASGPSRVIALFYGQDERADPDDPVKNSILPTMVPAHYGDRCHIPARQEPAAASAGNGSF